LIDPLALHLHLKFKESESNAGGKIIVIGKELYTYKHPSLTDLDDMAKLMEDRPIRNPGKCEGELTQGEVGERIDGGKTGKSPGPDGLPIEYYQSHSYEIIPFLTIYYNAIHSLGHLPPSMRDGIISLIFKKKGSAADLSNYRPITLLNSDLKILTAILASRISRIMCEVSDMDNSAAAPGRYISDNTMLLQLIQAFLDDEQLHLEKGIFINKCKNTCIYIFSIYLCYYMCEDMW
jgi:hypothetical protein